MVTPTPLSSEPMSMRRGDTMRWYRQAGEFTTDAWTLTYAFARQAASTVEVTATADSSSRWLVTVSAAVSATLDAGAWGWEARITGGISEAYTVATGSIVLEPSFSLDGTVDPRSFAERMVELLEARIERRAPNDVIASSAEAYSVSIMADADARAQLDYWRRRVLIERNAADTRSGRLTRTKIYTRFVSR